MHASTAVPPAGALVNACIHIMPDAAGRNDRPWDRTAEALLFVDGRVVQVGTNPEIHAEAKRRGIPATAVRDLGGRVVLPGFVDAHTHFLHVGVKHTRPDLREASSLDDCMARLAKWLKAHPGTGHVIGEGWDESNWPGHMRPSKADLDRVEPTRPVVLRRVCGHVAVANSAALPKVRARWDDERVDLATGILLEEPSLYLNEVLPSTPEQLDQALQEACRTAHQLGVTTLGDYSQAPYRQALLRAARAGTLWVRVASSIYVQQLEAEVTAGFRTGQASQGPRGPSELLRDGGLKVFHDGSLGAHTAALREPYCDHAHGEHPKGKLNWSDAEVRSHYATAHAAGIQLHAHAIGDAAIDQGLAAFRQLAGKPFGSPKSDGHGVRPARGVQVGTAAPGALPTEPRHRFEHYEIVHDDQMGPTAKLGIVASSQPNFVGTWSTKGGMYEERLGERFALNNRFQAMKKAGLEVAFGSDGMPFGPLPGLDAAVNHPVASERMTAAEAVWHYTNRAAWSLHWERDVGSLEPGKWADFVILDVHDLASRRPAAWVVEETRVGGVRRHRAGPPVRPDSS